MLSTDHTSAQNPPPEQHPLLPIARELSQKKGIIGLDKGLFAAFQQIHKIATYNINILLKGETGTGKELCAELIHNLSPYATGQLIKINCAALPETLLESELFGYEKGAFTGAGRAKMGKIELANNGTLFLDEIGELQLPIQSKLLRILQTKELCRLGGTTSRRLNFRLLTATNKNLEKAVAGREFRADLYYRISSFPLRIPPLRERKKDIPALTDYFCKKISHDTKLVNPPPAPGVKKELLQYSWPGNVRELENTLFQALILSQETGVITPEMISKLLAGNRKEGYTLAIEELMHKIITEKLDLKQINQDLINALLRHYDNNVSLIQQKTGLSKDKIYRYKRKTRI